MTQSFTKGVPIDTDGTMALNSNQVVPSQAAVVTYVGNNTASKITGDTGGALSPSAGNWNILGSSTAAGTTPVSTSGAVSTLTVNVQKSQAIAATDSTKVGLCNFDSGSFSVDANGFVTLAGGGLAIDSIHPNSGTDPVTPTAAGLVNIVGSGSITTVGSANTITTELTGLTQYAVLVGAGTSTITKVGPTATAGQVLQSAGNSANPAFSTATYPATTTINQILYSSAANVVGGITTANNSILSTGATGVPSFGTSLLNDYTFTSSTAAATRTLTVSNTDNTSASSTALIKATTGGASSGDAVFQASTTTTTWSFGVDNSVTSPTADTFVISQGTALGTNNIMSVATSGEILNPLQPAFLAYLGTQDDNVTGDGTLFTIGTGNALTEVFDQNSDFVTTGTFTAPITGRYQLSCRVGVTGSSAAGQLFAAITTSNRTYRGTEIPTGAGNAHGCTVSVLSDMDAADTAVAQCSQNGGTKTADVTTPGSYFSGFLAC